MYLNFAFNFGIQRTFIEKEHEDVYLDEAYLPLVRALEAVPEVRAGIFVDTLTLRIWRRKRPEILERLRTLADAGTVEFGTYTFSHPILSLIPFEDTRKQIEWALREDPFHYGRRPEGLLMPEGAWDPTISFIASELGLEYLIVSPVTLVRDYPDISARDLHRPFLLEGMRQRRPKALAVDQAVHEDETQVYVCGAVVQGPDENARQITDRMDELTRKGADKDSIVILKQDAEFIYEDALAGKYGRKQGRDGWMAGLGESIPELVEEATQKLISAWEALLKAGVSFTSTGRYLERRQKDLPIRRLRGAFGWYKTLSEWLAGSEKLAAMLDEARSEIKRAEWAAALMRRSGHDTSNAEHAVQEAWEALLSAEISIGRRASAHPAGKASRINRAMEDALTAIETARRVLDM